MMEPDGRLSSLGPRGVHGRAAAMPRCAHRAPAGILLERGFIGDLEPKMPALKAVVKIH